MQETLEKEVKQIGVRGESFFYRDAWHRQSTTVAISASAEQRTKTDQALIFQTARELSVCTLGNPYIQMKVLHHLLQQKGQGSFNAADPFDIPDTSTKPTLDHATLERFYQQLLKVNQNLLEKPVDYQRILGKSGLVGEQTIECYRIAFGGYTFDLMYAKLLGLAPYQSAVAERTEVDFSIFNR